MATRDDVAEEENGVGQGIYKPPSVDRIARLESKTCQGKRCVLQITLPNL